MQTLTKVLLGAALVAGGYYGYKRYIAKAPASTAPAQTQVAGSVITGLVGRATSGIAQAVAQLPIIGSGTRTAPAPTVQASGALPLQMYQAPVAQSYPASGSLVTFRRF